MGIEVKVNGDFDKALKKFKKKVKKDGILMEWRRKRWYEKPSQKRRRKELRIKKKWEKINAKRKMRELSDWR